MNRTFAITAGAFVAGITFTSPVEAAVLNGGFENDLNDWQTIGEVEVVTSEFGSGTVEGDAQVLLSTAFNEVLDFGENGEEIIGGEAVPASRLSEFLGSLPSLVTGQPIEGSAIKTTFTPEIGDRLNFSWNFLTDEAVRVPGYLFNDYAFAILQSELGTETFLLSDTTSNLFSPPSQSETAFYSETGFESFSVPIQTGITYTLALGVVDIGPSGQGNRGQLISGLLVDNVQVVPETTPILGILFFGALGTALKLKRSQKKTELLS